MRTLAILFIMGLFMSTSFIVSRREKKVDAGQDVMPVVCQTNAAQALSGQEESLATQSTNFFATILDTESWPAR